MREAYQRIAPEPTQALYALSRSIQEGPLPGTLRELLSVRVSQINGCAHCVDVHWQKALQEGVSQRKLRLLPAFREAGVYTAGELTALELAEAVTLLGDKGVSEELWRRVRDSFPDEVVRLHLLYQVILMNSWNRLSVALNLLPPK